MDNKANGSLIRDFDQQIQKIEQAKRKEIAKEIKAIVKSMRALKITLSDLSVAGADKIAHSDSKIRKAKKVTGNAKVGRKTKKEAKGADGRSKVQAKYRDPATGAEWTGRGHAPTWMTEYEKNGRNRTEFLIKI